MSNDTTSAYVAVLDRADALCSLLEGEVRAQGERIVAVCRALAEPQRLGAVAPSRQIELRVELARLVELLSRRGSNAIPLATLGRAALADLAGDERSLRQACRECDANLTLVGL